MIDGIFATMDADQSGDVSDSEWAEFFTEFIEPFVGCDADLDYLLTTAEFTACFTDNKKSKINILKNSFTGKEA
jgi:hypothetical protein